MGDRSGRAPTVDDEDKMGSTDLGCNAAVSPYCDTAS